MEELQSAFIPEKQAQLKALDLTVAEKVREYFKDPAHRRQFEVWYMEKHGKPYVWRRIDGKEVNRRA